MSERSFNAAPAAIAVLVASALLMAVLLNTLPNYLTSDPAGSRADIVMTTVSAAGLVAAIGAAIAAFFTIFQQQVENRRQRQMQTLHILNEAYDAIFADIYRIRRDANSGAETERKAISEDDMRLVYSRYFTALATGLRYFQLGLVPKEDFVDWTGNLVARFASEKCIVNFDKPLEASEIKHRWQAYERRVFGPRKALRRYMSDIWLAAGQGAPTPTYETRAPADLVREARRIVRRAEKSL